VEDGVCVGDVVLDKVLADFFNPFVQKDALKLRLIGIDRADGLSRAALITPIGIFDFRAQPDGSYFARFDPKRTLSLKFGSALMMLNHVGTEGTSQPQNSDVLQQSSRSGAHLCHSEAVVHSAGAHDPALIRSS
jgi:hypothetical protein